MPKAILESLSLPSRQGAFVLDVPDVHNTSLEYVYNFYKENEREISEDIEIIQDSSNLWQYSSYIAVNIEYEDNDILTQNQQNIISRRGLSNEEILSKVFTEKDFSGNIFTGIATSLPNEIQTLQNLVKESTTVLNSEIENFNIDEISTTDFIRSTANMVNSNGFLFSNESKNKLTKLFENASNESLGQNQSNNPPLDFIGYSFNANYYSPILDDIVLSAQENATSISSNSFSSIKTRLENISKNAIDSASNTRSSISNYYPVVNNEMLVDDVSIISQIFDGANGFSASETQFDQLEHIGFRVKMSGVLDSGDNTIFSDRFIRNVNLREFYIVNIPYNSRVSITVEPVYIMRLPAITSFETYSVETTCSILVAGSGRQRAIYAINTTKPNPPQDLKFDIDSNGLEISWSLPYDTQRSITKFRVFKRKSINEPFTLIRQIDFGSDQESEVPAQLIDKVTNLKTYFIDRSFNLNSKNIYAITAVSAHDLTSNYSEQIEVKFNTFSNKLEKKIISRIGSLITYPNMNIDEEIFDDVIKSSGFKSMSVYFNPDFIRVYRTTTAGTQDDLVNLNVSGNSTNKTFKINLINIDLQEKQTIDIIINRGLDRFLFDSGDSAVVRTFLES